MVPSIRISQLGHPHTQLKLKHQQKLQLRGQSPWRQLAVRSLPFLHHLHHQEAHYYPVVPVLVSLEKQCHWHSHVPDTLLWCNGVELLNHWLSLYVIETKQSNGKDFPSKTIDLLLSGLKRYMVAQLKEKDPSICPINFLSESDHRFNGLRGTRDWIACERWKI